VITGFFGNPKINERVEMDVAKLSTPFILPTPEINLNKC